jgi:hypothetical protein
MYERKPFSRLLHWRSEKGQTTILAVGPTGLEVGGTLNGNGGEGLSPPVLTPKKWHHVVWTSRGRDLVVYVDGVLQPLRPHHKWKADKVGVFVGSKREGSHRDFCGAIDELMRFDSVLSADEVKRLYEMQRER